MTLELNLLARQLSQLGQDLQEEIDNLARMEEESVNAEGTYRYYKEAYEDALAASLLKSRMTNSEARKAEARLSCVTHRKMMEDANLDWDHKKAKLRTQHANLQALHRRIEVGRSLLSREKALVGLEHSGVG